MRIDTLKNKISKSLDEMDNNELKKAWLILKELKGESKTSTIPINKEKLASQISNGIAQLDKGEGTDFQEFIGTMKTRYGNK